MNVRISARRRHCRSALARERLYRVRHHRDGSTVNPSIRRARSSFEPETRLIPQADPVVAGPGQSEPHPATTPSTRADPDPACACRCLRLGYSSTLMTMPRGTPAPASWPLCRCFAARGCSRRPFTALSGETSSGQRITQRRRERRASRLGYLCHGLPDFDTCRYIFGRFHRRVALKPSIYRTGHSISADTITYSPRACLREESGPASCSSSGPCWPRRSRNN